MTKQEKEILNWIIDRSWEKKANPVVIAAALEQLFPGGAEEINKELEEMKKDCCKEKKNNEDNL